MSIATIEIQPLRYGSRGWAPTDRSHEMYFVSRVGDFWGDLEILRVSWAGLHLVHLYLSDTKPEPKP